jgi:hypothetical protein
VAGVTGIIDKGDEAMWTFVGTMNCGESIFWSKDSGLAVEKDHLRLVEATPEETAEIYKRMSHLIPTKETKR